ncbi:MAG: helix-hairpin-helix domain-containing protein [Caldilineaceae bacterium]
MTTNRNVIDPLDASQDDLTRIRGIGSKTAKAFYVSGFCRFTDLAQSSPEALAKALLDGGDLKFSPERIDALGWIELARSLVQQTQEEQGAPLQKLADTPPTEKGTEVSVGAQAARWQQHAGFSLFFDHVLDNRGKETWQTRIWRTRGYHDETGELVQFPDIELRHWATWIMKQANLPVDIEAELNPPTPAKVTILDVQVEATMEPDVHTKKLVTEIQFALSNAHPALNAPESTPYQILLLLVEQEHNQTMLIAAEQCLLYPDQPIHTHRVEFPVPDVGRYALQTFVLVQAETELMAGQRGPTINVIP